MIVDLYVSSDDLDASSHNLAAWLNDDRPLSQALVSLTSARQAVGDMGPAADLVRVILEPGGLVVALASAIGGWVVSRTGRIRLRVRRGDTEISIEAPKMRDAEKIAALIQKHLNQPEP